MADSRIAGATFARDLRLELRTRESLNAMLFYALLVVVIFSFAFESEAELTARVGGGLLWVAFLFAGLVALDRAFVRELPGDSLTGLLLSPAPRAALMAGKFASSFILMLAIEMVLLPLFAVLFNVSPAVHWSGIVLTVVLGTWALAVTGTYFSAMSIHTRHRALLLPLLLLPVVIPAVISMVQATQVFLGRSGVADYWWKLLFGFDVVFTTLGLLLADIVLDVD